MKLQVVIKKGSSLWKHFQGIPRERAEEARRLMLHGLLGPSLEATVERTIQSSLAAASIVMQSQGSPATEGGEDAEAGAAADDALGDYLG